MSKLGAKNDTNMFALLATLFCILTTQNGGVVPDHITSEALSLTKLMLH